MSFNVVWNNSGFGVKGNRHNISHNTVFDAADIGASKSPRTFPSYQDGTTPLDYCGAEANKTLSPCPVSCPLVVFALS
jgi:hypothetical protein